MKPARTIELPEPDDITICEALRHAVRYLTEAGILSAYLDASILLSRVLGVEREYLMMHRDSFMSDAELIAFDALLGRRVAREPISQILGVKEFWSLPFWVTADTLTPRPDSETLIEVVMRYKPPSKERIMVADFGTGTGCLLLSLLSEYPAGIGLGVDISKSALAVAQENAEHLGFSGRVDLHCTSWGDGVEGKYDIIVSNPPYIPEGEIDALEPEVALYEPRLALSGGEDGLDPYRNLLPHVTRLLAPTGIAVVECGEGQAEKITELVERNHMQVLEICRDIAGISRCVVMSHA